MVTFIYIVDICSEKNFALYTFDSDYPDTSLNRNYLKKQSSPDKRGLRSAIFVAFNYEK